MSGPEANPKTKMDTTKVGKVVEVFSNSSAMIWTAGASIDETSGLLVSETEKVMELLGGLHYEAYDRNDDDIGPFGSSRPIQRILRVLVFGFVP